MMCQWTDSDTLCFFFFSSRRRHTRCSRDWSSDVCSSDLVMEDVSGKEALMALVANSYVNYLLDQTMRRTEFDVLGRVVAEIPIRRVRSPDEPSAIFGLCEATAADVRREITTAPGNPTPVAG